MVCVEACGNKCSSRDDMASLYPLESIQWTPKFTTTTSEDAKASSMSTRVSSKRYIA
eukprot:CAMPEP_0182485700 /NCGR_PEP_ID=MMETSP1319-20130603/45718_1 /TAXON_ID=172717 /ORGANISM="Bolidomonas pacifica, Strain RCC208" /LENGTH=56 /DNA_ID=CAMNT_0024687717 /DNA_START=392 /DNA_END=562 /DNA_ORIENTATION=-